MTTRCPCEEGERCESRSRVLWTTGSFVMRLAAMVTWFWAVDMSPVEIPVTST